MANIWDVMFNSGAKAIGGYQNANLMNQQNEYNTIRDLMAQANADRSFNANQQYRQDSLNLRKAGNEQAQDRWNRKMIYDDRMRVFDQVAENNKPAPQPSLNDIMAQWYMANPNALNEYMSNRGASSGDNPPDPQIAQKRGLDIQAKENSMIDAEIARQRERELQNFISKGGLGDDPLANPLNAALKRHLTTGKDVAFWNEGSQPARDSASVLQGFGGQAPQVQAPSREEDDVISQVRTLSANGQQVNFQALQADYPNLDWNYIMQGVQ